MTLRAGEGRTAVKSVVPGTHVECRSSVRVDCRPGYPRGVSSARPFIQYRVYQAAAQSGAAFAQAAAQAEATARAVPEEDAEMREGDGHQYPRWQHDAWQDANQQEGRYEIAAEGPKPWPSADRKEARVGSGWCSCAVF